MRLRSVHAHLHCCPINRPYEIAGRRISSTTQLIVRVEDREGLVGLGSGAPSAAVTGESVVGGLQAAQRALQLCLSGREAEDPLTMAKSSAFAALTEGCPAGRAAVEMALFDLAARRRGVPLVDFLGRHHRSLPTSVTIGIQSTQSTLLEVRRLLDAGFNVLKIKIGNDVESDIATLHAVRGACGPSVRLRVDPNQGYDAGALQRFVVDTGALGLELIEQPMPRGVWNGRSSTVFDSAPPFAADEDILDAADAARLARHRIYDVFNIKLMKCGGVIPALDIARIAAASDIALMWGCMDESVIGIAAALHTAFACPNTRYLDLDGSFDLADDVAVGGFVVERGIMTLTDAPGLGVTDIPPRLNS